MVPETLDKPVGLRKRTILLGVTSDMSIRLMSGFPQYLAAHDWNVHVVSSPGPLLDKLSRVPGITTHGIPMVRKPAPLADLIALAKWITLLLRLRPDVTSVGTPKAGLLGGIAAWLTRVPARVYVLRGLPLETATGMKLKLLVMFERLSFATARSALAVSPSLRDRAVQLGLGPLSKIRVLGAGSSNGVDLEHFRPLDINDSSETEDKVVRARQLGLESGVPVIGFVGRLTDDKGLSHLARARQELFERNVDHQLLIVGGLDDSAAPEALKLLDRVGRRPSIQTGHVQDTAPYYHIMDVLCLPTRREGFPNVVLEASASGIPTVTTDATGAIDSVIEGETGLVTSVTSAAALANGLAILCQDARLRRKMGEAARLRVQNEYGQPLVWGNLEDFYVQSLALGSKSRRQANVMRGS